MIMLLVKGLILLALVGMIFSPKYFFQWLDKFLFSEPYPEQVVHHVHRDGEIQLDSSDLELDEHRMSNIDRMIAQATTDNQKKTWEIKKAEYTRNQKWKRLVEFSGATSR